MITSRNNDLIKKCIKIKEKKYSKAESLCLVQSIKIVSQLYIKNMLECILVTEDKYDLVKLYSRTKIEIISNSIASELSDSVSNDGVFAICRIPSNRASVDYSRCLVLDKIQDPSNLGSIIRSAYAFGFKTIFSIDSVYPFSYKGIRSSMGYIFDVDFIDTDYNEFLEYKKSNNITLLSADLDGEIVDKDYQIAGNIALIIGNEGNGVSDQMSKMADKIISIPMKNDVESLNASVSAGILMYLLK